ncbi:MAG: hypothetical protein ACOC5T_08715 [Elusimicrobiota bacterium]
MNKLTGNSIFRKYKKFSVSENEKHGKITLKDNVSKCMNRKNVGHRSKSNQEKEIDTHPCTWQEVYKANRVSIPYFNKGVII